MKNVRRAAAVVLSVLMFVGLFFGCMYFAKNTRDYYVDNPGRTDSGIDFKVTSMDKLVAEYVNTGLERDIVISGTGNIMFYEWQLERAYDEASQSFDFSDSFQYISKYLEDSALVLGNLETTMAGKDKGVYTNFYGYGANMQDMNFNSPEAAADNLKAAGFDVLSTANEHALDSKTEGLLNTLKTIKAAGLEAVGTKEAAGDKNYIIKKANGMNVGIAAYTNKLTTAADETNSGLINSMDNYSEEKIEAICNDIKQMKAEGAEAVVVMLHFGEDYAETPDDNQRNTAHKLAEAGADVIFGSHTHTLQPIEIYPVKDEDGTERKSAIIYSMGNFLSSQQYKEGTGNRDIGGIFNVVFGKKGDDVTLKEIDIVPTYVNWTDETIAIIPVCEAQESTESFGDIFNTSAKSRIKAAYDTIIPELLKNSGVNYTYSDYKYKISVENS